MRIICFLLATFLLFIGFVMSSNKQEYRLSRGEQLVNSILAKTAKIIKDKCNIKPCGVGVAMPGGPIQEVTLCFDTRYPYTKEQLRDLLIKTSQILLEQVNENKEIQKFLNKSPFTINNVEIIIYNNEKTGMEVFDPGISVARISQKTLIYRTTNANDVFKYKNEYEETYEEALKALSKS